MSSATLITIVKQECYAILLERNQDALLTEEEQQELQTFSL